ncbi:G-type lectin S-receptor-like serine/threonine-protein kinase At4g27290 [Primulina eburnea]|uniref:G-type lectin S-receptor-like serine/threonine-protein kinase At4g27290 n=1 Tax=Primulina eburnea TaxID=1245227 RepID=UPI003C6BE42D
MNVHLNTSSRKLAAAMKTSQKGILLILLFIFQTTFGATDILTTDEIIRDGETLVSSDGVFELGFFKPGNSMNRYVGMWYKNIPDRKIVWVANRNSPLTSAGGLLKVVQPGLLVLLNDTNDTVWSSNKSRPVQKPIAQLLDSGNLVVRDANDDRPENFLWQSFDYPSNVALPEIKFGWNLVTGTEIYFPAWKSDDDPSPGALSIHLDPTGYPQILMKEGSKIRSRMGPWNGITFSGGPIDFQIPMYRLRLVMNQKEVRYFQETIDKSFVTIVAISPGGVAERWAWINSTQRWMMYISFPADNCDTYRLCGAYGSCSIANSPLCTCMDRFVPKDPEGWAKADWNKGCVRRTNLSCQGDKFLKYSGIKLPDARYTRNKANMTLEECRAECLKSCSCMAYTLLDILKGNGCLIWYKDLIDVKSMVSDGQDIYIRMASTEAESVAEHERKKRKKILTASFASALGIGLIGLSLSLYLRKRSIDPTISRQGKYHSIQEKNSEVPLFDLSYILKSTDNFATDKKLGEGGFGPVYKGMLEDGQEIAVKRLSKDSMQGLDEFKNEIVFIAKLQHRNLVRLIGGCVQEDENMLIYEYMPNKSLDMILFDQKKKILLDWKKRFNIINGIARGLLYLHQDSRLTIIHRDLKASNILLDSDMNPKISDFGIARSFGGNETAAKTHRVIGTYGYMSPEYAIDGLFSIKSDVFSFGVLALEIVTGMSNRRFIHADHNLNLLGHAWTLYKEGRSLELVDPCLAETSNIHEMRRTIHVSLLCVQQYPKDRPIMSAVVTMLSNEGFFPPPKQPGFFTEREVLAAQSPTMTNAGISANEVTITLLEAR